VRAIGIVRVSTAEQANEERFSIPHQKNHIHEECQRRGLNLVYIFEFVQSGAKVLSSSGHERAEILTYIKNFNVSVVVVHELDRLARSMLDTLLFVDELNKMHVAFISIHDGFDTSTAQGQLQMHILAAFAEYFRKQLASKVVGGMLERARQGKPLGKIPFGYEMDDSGLKIIPEEAQIVKLIFQWYLEENIGMRGIACRLNSMSIGTKRNNLWSHVTVRTVLENEIYTGTFTWQSIRVENAHPAIIDKTTYHLAQKRRHRKKALGGQSQNSSYLLSGLLRCARCGASMTGHSQKKNHIRYRYYTCQSYASKGLSACKAGSVNARVIEEKVLADLDSLVNSINIIIPREFVVLDTTHLKKELQLKENQLLKNKMMLQRAAAAYETGEYDLELFRTRKNDLLIRKVEILGEIETLRKKLKSRSSGSNIAQKLHNRLKAAGMLLTQTELPKAKARLQEIIHQIDVVNINHLIIYYRI
jgi:site-specific DNA recombinase